MWFNKKKAKRNKYIVSYINGCLVTDSTMTFDRKYTEKEIVEADDIMDAGVQFAKNHVLYPHVCIDRIEKVV